MTVEEKLDLIMSMSFLTYTRIRLESSFSRQVYLAEKATPENNGDLWNEAHKIARDLASVDSEFCRLARCLLKYSKGATKNDILSTEFFDFDE